MKIERILIATVLAAGSISAQAHEFDPGGRIVVSCAGDREPRMADVARAVGDSHYWAPQGTRREILELARQACSKGSDEVVFVPSADQRYAANGSPATTKR